MKNVAAMVLCGGEGTRFNEGKPSPIPKVLYEVGGKLLIFYSLESLGAVGVGEVVVVVGYKGDEIKKALGGRYKYALQEKPLGTGDATLSGLDKVSDQIEAVMVLYGGDIYSEETLKGALSVHSKEKPAVTFVTQILDVPAGFGRIIRDDKGQIKAIVEEKVATDDQKKIKEVNDGCFVFDKKWLTENIKSLALSKAKEYFLTDLVEIAMGRGEKISTYTIKKPTDWIGVDSPEDIKNAEKRLEGRS